MHRKVNHVWSKMYIFLTWHTIWVARWEYWLTADLVSWHVWLVHRDNQRSQRWLWWAGSNYSSGITIRTWLSENVKVEMMVHPDGVRETTLFFLFLYFNRLRWPGGQRLAGRHRRRYDRYVVVAVFWPEGMDINSSRSRAERKGMSATQRANRIQPCQLRKPYEIR